MIYLRWIDGCAPIYKTKDAAAADLTARERVVIPAGTTAKVATGVWIESVDWDQVPSGAVPELQIRARSGLAYKHSLMLTNGVGTIDADYRDEICALLYNGGKSDFVIEVGDRVAQILCAVAYRLPVELGTTIRRGGFGSTGVAATSTH